MSKIKEIFGKTKAFCIEHRDTFEKAGLVVGAIALGVLVAAVDSKQRLQMAENRRDVNGDPYKYVQDIVGCDNAVGYAYTNYGKNYEEAEKSIKALSSVEHDFVLFYEKPKYEYVLVNLKEGTNHLQMGEVLENKKED